MKVLEMLDELEEMIDVRNNFFGNKVSIDKAKAIQLITEIRIALPDDFKQAEWISQERQRIIIDAEEMAEEMISNAKKEAAKLVEEDNITKMAKRKADTMIKKAQNESVDIRNTAIFYSQNLLKEVSKELAGMVDDVMKNYEELDSMVIKKENRGTKK